MITGALILAAGVALGWLLRSLPARRKGPKPVEAVCGCGHHHSMHDPQSRACAAEDRDYLGDGRYSAPRTCKCLRYTGPEPLPSYYAPEIAGEAGQ